MNVFLRTALVALPLLLVAAYSESVRLTEIANGASPAKPEPTNAPAAVPPATPEPVPVANARLAVANGWVGGGRPMAAEGLRATVFAAGLHHPRWLFVLPNGDVLVTESGATARRAERSGLQGLLASLLTGQTSATAPVVNRITLLRDSDGDGIADQRHSFLTGLTQPFGMALLGDAFYVADAGAVLRFAYRANATSIGEPGETLLDLSTDEINRRGLTNLIASPDGKHLYVTVDGDPDAGASGIGRATVLELDPASDRSRVFAPGSGDAVGLAWNNESGALWTATNARGAADGSVTPDLLAVVTQSDVDSAHDKQPAEANIDLRQGADLQPAGGAPQQVVLKIAPGVQKILPAAQKILPAAQSLPPTIAPDYALGQATASRGLVFAAGALLPKRFRNGAFIAQQAAANGNPGSGYKVVFVPFVDGHPAGRPQYILTGFISAAGNALGRPVGLAVDHAGALLVADDIGNVIWRVAPPRAVIAEEGKIVPRTPADAGVIAATQ